MSNETGTGLKSFLEMRKVDISAHIRKRPLYKKDRTGNIVALPESEWLPYLPWESCLTLLYENGATEVEYGFYENADNYPAFYINGRNPFVKVWVRVDGRKWEMHYPVIDGDRCNEFPNQMSVHWAQQRAFVKCVAINTGLGLQAWHNEEKPNPAQVEETNRERNKSLNEALLKRFAELVKSFGDTQRVYDVLGATKKTFTALTSENNISAKEEMLEQMNGIQWSKEVSTGHVI